MRRTGERDWDSSPHPAMSYSPSLAMRRTRALVSVLFSIAVVAVLWSLLWYGALIWVQVQYRDWVNTQFTHGSVAQYADYEVSGYPARIILRFVEPHYRGKVFGESVDWRGDALVLSAPVWMPWRMRIDVPGKVELILKDRKMKFTGRVKTLSGVFTPGREWQDNFKLYVQKLTLKGSSPVVIDDLNLRSFGEDQTLSLALSGRGWTLPLGDGWGLGDRIEKFDARVRVKGVLSAQGALAQRLASWRDAGGTVQVERLKVRAGPFALGATGTLTLDRDLQPQGAFTAKMKGLFSVLEILRAKGRIQGPNAVLATMALAAFSTRSKDGGASSISLPVSVKGGQLSLGPVSLVKVPRITWGIVEKIPKKIPPRNYKDVPPVF